MAGAGRVAIGALIGAATAALFFEGLSGGPQLGALPTPRPGLDNPVEPGQDTVEVGRQVEVSGTLISATSAGMPNPGATSTSESSTTTTVTSTTTMTTTTTTTASGEQPTITTTTTTTEPPPPTTTTTTTRRTTTTTRRPCGIFWCP